MLIELIENRRSVREYKQTEVPKELVEEVVDAARLAPSGCNAQPIIYYIVDGGKTREMRKREVFYQDFVYAAPTLIVCCGNPKAYKIPEGYARQRREGSVPEDVEERMGEFFSGEQKVRERVIRDVSIASTYLVLRATELGLGTCYVGWFEEHSLKDILKLPRDYVIPFVITVGYPKKIPEQTPRKRLDEIII